MREVCGPAWREQAIRLMTGPPFPRLLKLHELKESAMAAGLCPGTGIDPLADRAHALKSPDRYGSSAPLPWCKINPFPSRRRRCSFRRVDRCPYISRRSSRSWVSGVSCTVCVEARTTRCDR